jgi:hypothetical protein
VQNVKGIVNETGGSTGLSRNVEDYEEHDCPRNDLLQHQITSQPVLGAGDAKRPLPRLFPSIAQGNLPTNDDHPGGPP